MIQTGAVCIGDNCIDHYLEPVDCCFSGGNAVNVAVYLQRAGVPTAYIGAVGDDTDGKRLLSDLSGQGVDVTHAQILPGITAYTDVCLTPQGDREFLKEEIGVQVNFALRPEDFEFIRARRLVHNTWMGRTENELARYKQIPGLLVSQDYGERYTSDFLDRTIQNVDVAFFSLPENAQDDPASLAARMRGRGPRLVVVTHGNRGSLADDGQQTFHPAIPTRVVDTLGAGDAYIGSFLGRWLCGESIFDSMHFAAQTASRACTHYGAWLASEPIHLPNEEG